MIPASPACQSIATACDEVDEQFEPHVSGAGSLRALKFIRYCSTLDAAGNGNGVGCVAIENPIDRAQFGSRHFLEASTRLIEAASVGAGRAFTAGSLNDLVQAQHELIHIYLDWLSFIFRATKK